MKIFQLHPTLDCNQSCVWCPYLGESGGEIEFPEIRRQLYIERRRGCPILKISGGGEPMLYLYFKELLRYACDIGYTVYLQTNGSLLDNFTREYVYDIRISYGDGIDFSPPDIHPDGFSYVVSRYPEYDNLRRVIHYAQKYGIYVRVTPDDTDIENVPSIAEIKANLPESCSYVEPGISEANRLLKRGVSFWDAFTYHPGKNPCPCHDSPLLTPYGWAPCCKTHVAKGVVPGYNKSMILGWEYPEIPYDGSSCTRCYY